MLSQQMQIDDPAAARRKELLRRLAGQPVADATPNPLLSEPDQEEPAVSPERDPSVPTLRRAGEDAAGQRLGAQDYSPLQEQADFAAGRARNLKDEINAVQHPGLKNTLIQALIEAAPIAIGAIAGGGEGAGAAAEGVVGYQRNRQAQEGDTINRLTQQMEHAQEQQGTFAAQAATQAPQLKRQSLLDELNRKNVQSEIDHRNDRTQVIPHYFTGVGADGKPTEMAVTPGGEPQAVGQVYEKPAAEPAATMDAFEREFKAENGRLPTLKDRMSWDKEHAKQTRAPAPAGSVSGDDAEAIADAIISGDQPPVLTGLYRNGAPVRAALARKGFDLTTADLDFKAIGKHLATLNGAQQERLRQAVSFTTDSLGLIEDLYAQWKKVGPNSGFRVFNKAGLASAKQLPGKAGEVASNLEAQINDLTSELGTVYKGGNSSTDESLKLATANLQADWNEQTFTRAISQIRKNLTIRSNSIKNSQAAGVSANTIYGSEAAGTAPEGPSDEVFGKDGKTLLGHIVGGKFVPIGK